MYIVLHAIKVGVLFCPVVKNTWHIDATIFVWPKDDEVTAAPDVLRDVKNKDTRQNVVAAFGTDDICLNPLTSLHIVPK